MNEVNFVPTRILIKKRRRHSLIKQLIIISILLFTITILVFLPLKTLNTTQNDEIIAFKHYQIYQNILNANNKNKVKNMDKIQELEKNRIKIGDIIKSIKAISIKNIKIVNIKYQPSTLLIKGCSGSFNTITNYGKAVKSIKLITSANLIDIEFDKVNGAYNFNYKVTP